MKKNPFLVLTSGKFLEALGSGIGTGSIFCLSFSLLNRVTYLVLLENVQFMGLLWTPLPTLISDIINGRILTTFLYFNSKAKKRFVKNLVQLAIMKS